MADNDDDLMKGAIKQNRGNDTGFLENIIFKKSYEINQNNSFLKTKYEEHFYVIFRIGIGALFLMFGVQKLFGIWNMPGGAASFGTLVWYAGAGELLIGLGVLLGVLTRLAAVFGIIEMAVAYYLGHASVGGWNPAVNQGTSALLFLLAFVAVLAYGAKKASLEHTILGKEVF